MLQVTIRSNGCNEWPWPHDQHLVDIDNALYLLPPELFPNVDIVRWVEAGLQIHKARVEARGHIYLNLVESSPCLGLLGSGQCPPGLVGDDEFIIERGTKEKRHIIGVPIALLVRGCGKVSGKHLVYSHSFLPPSDDDPANNPFTIGYVGITGRHWCLRLLEHIWSASGGSRYSFHVALRQFLGCRPLVSRIRAAGLSFEDAMQVEEDLAWLTIGGQGLNMIPGGFAGLSFLGRRGFTARQKNWEHRETTIEKLRARAERRGRPDPLAALRWNDEFKKKMVCGNRNNFSEHELGLIEFMACAGNAIEEIAAKFSANPRRVRNFISGRTYTFMHMGEERCRT